MALTVAERAAFLAMAKRQADEVAAAKKAAEENETIANALVSLAAELRPATPVTTTASTTPATPTPVETASTTPATKTGNNEVPWYDRGLVGWVLGYAEKK